MDQSLPPGLYIVATPIGNLGDMTSRAADTLCRVDYILAEDKRVSAKLLAHIGAKAPMTAYHDHSDEKLRERILADLGTKAVALISDAGTPLISDPGYKLVRAARQAGHVSSHAARAIRRDRRTDAWPACQPTAFSSSAFCPPSPRRVPTPSRKWPRSGRALVFYESGPRLGESLAALAEILGDREAAVIREITKLHEET